MTCDEVDFEVSLQILNVVGYEFQNDRILLRCTLNGNQLQTEPVIARTDKVQVNAHITWTTTKKEIKRMKAENLPLKVECFRVREKNDRLQLIGYTLIPLRIIPTLLTKNEQLSSPRWYKLHGVPNNVAHNRPELYLNVIIQPEQDVLDEGYENAFDESVLEPDFSNHFELEFDAEDVINSTRITQNECPFKSTTAAAAVDHVNYLTCNNTISSIKNTDKILNAEEGEEEHQQQTKDAGDNQMESEQAMKERYMVQLEQWKNVERENFLANLKKMENNFLETMFEEWQRKRQEEEHKLKQSIEECGRLSQKLEECYVHFKEVDEKQGQTAKEGVMTDELKRAWREKEERLEVDLKEEREENKQLRNRIRELEKAVNEQHRLKEQTVNENKELLAALHKTKESKDYYKQKWVLLIREVNKLGNGDEEELPFGY